MAALVDGSSDQIIIVINVINKPFMRDRMVQYFRTQNEFVTATVTGFQDTVVYIKLNIKSTDTSRIEQFSQQLTDVYYIQRPDSMEGYVYGRGEDMDVAVASWIANVLEEKMAQLTEDLDEDSDESFYDEWRRSDTWEALDRDIKTSIFSDNLFRVYRGDQYRAYDGLHQNSGDDALIHIPFKFEILFNKEEAIRRFTEWLPNSGWNRWLVRRHDISVTWDFEERQSKFFDQDWTWDEDNWYLHTNSVTFTIPESIQPEIFGSLYPGGVDYDTYEEIELTGEHSNEIEFQDWPDWHSANIENTTPRKYDIYFVYKNIQPPKGEYIDSTKWSEMITTMKDHTAKCIVKFCNTHLKGLDDDEYGNYQWKLTTESENMLTRRQHWKQWFNWNRNGRQPKSFTVQTIPNNINIGEDNVYPDMEVDEDTPIPQFYDTLVHDNTRVLQLGEDISYRDLLALGSFNISERLIYDNYLDDAKDVGCSSVQDHKIGSNILYPIRTGPSQSQIYCMGDFMKWIRSVDYNEQYVDPLDKIDPGSREQLYNRQTEKGMTIHIMDRNDIQKQEWKDIQNARESLNAEKSRLNGTERMKIIERRRNLETNTVLSNELKNKLGLKFRQQEIERRRDVRKVEEKLARLPTTERRLTLAKVDRNSVARVFAKLKF